MQHLHDLEAASGGAEALGNERKAKRERLLTWLEQNGHSGILLRRHENLAWLAAGQFEARVGLFGEAAVGALLVLRDGRSFAIAPNNEAPRLAAEELARLDAELVQKPWYALDLAAEALHFGGTGVVADLPTGSLPTADPAALRAPLLPSEIARFRALCADTADVVTQATLALRPGVSEYEMEALVAEPLLRRGILPSVLLMAVDDRILQYKHAVARGAKLQRFAMLNLCTRRWGLACSITRFVHFGALPAALQQGFATATRVNAALQHATRESATADALFRTASEAYAEAGFAGDEQLHHQGGACGYLEREWVAAPGGTQRVRTPQAFAWNPSSRGGKVEDTTLRTDAGWETLTRTPGLPEVVTELEGEQYTAAAPLVHA